MGEKLKNMEKRLSDLVDSKNGDAMTTTCDNVDKTYASVVAVDKTMSGNPKRAQNAEAQKSNHNINQSFRIQGLKEDPSKSKAGNFVPTNSEQNEILFTIGAEPHVLEFKRLGKFDPERKKPRPLLVTVENEHQARLALAKSHEHSQNLTKRNNYFLAALSREDAMQEYLILKTRRQLLAQGVPREMLRIRNLELFNDGKNFHLESEKTDSP